MNSQWTKFGDAVALNTELNQHRANLTYQAGDRCPACGGKSWFIRNITAQCAFCECALPVAGGSST